MFSLISTRNVIALFVALASTSYAGTAGAHEYKLGPLVIDHPWSRATPEGATVGAGYMTITNHGREADTLTTAEVSFADHVELHEMAMEGDVMTMRPLTGGIPIPAGQTVVLKPGSLHLMFMGLKAPLREGESVEGMLTFEKAGRIAITYEVEAMGAQGNHHHGDEH